MRMLKALKTFRGDFYIFFKSNADSALRSVNDRADAFYL